MYFCLAVHTSRLLKRVDQARGVILASHLFWAGVREEASHSHEEKSSLAKGHDGIGKSKDEKQFMSYYRNGKRVLECLQKALKIADSVLDARMNVELFVEILERYVWFYDNRNETVMFYFICI